MAPYNLSQEGYGVYLEDLNTVEGYDFFDVDWGDGSTPDTNCTIKSIRTHTYDPPMGCFAIRMIFNAAGGAGKKAVVGGTGGPIQVTVATIPVVVPVKLTNHYDAIRTSNTSITFDITDPGENVSGEVALESWSTPNSDWETAEIDVANNFVNSGVAINLTDLAQNIYRATISVNNEANDNTVLGYYVFEVLE